LSPGGGAYLEIQAGLASTQLVVRRANNLLLDGRLLE